MIPQLKIDDEKVVLLGDTHFGARSDSQLFHDRFELFYNFMFDYMKQNGLKTIIQFGDLFDRRKYINFNSLNRSRTYFFDKLKEYGFNCVALIGNHDIPYKNTLDGNSPSLLLGEYASVMTLVQQPTEMQLGKTSALVIPWICNDNEDECMLAIRDSKAELCFGHFELQGFEMYRGAVCEHGQPKEMFEKFTHVYSGHFHHISSKDNITYLGSPYQITWADHGDDRGFFVLDTTDLHADFVSNPFPNFHKLVYDDRELTLDDLDAMDYSSYSRTFVKVIVSHKTNLFLYDKFIEKLELAGAIAHAVDDHKYKNIISEEELASGVDDINDLLKKVSESYKDNCDTDKLYAYLLDLYTTAVNTQQV